MLGFLDYFFPWRCVGCERILAEKNTPICLNCYYDLTLSHWKMQESNPVYDLLLERVHLHQASALLLFENGNLAQKLIQANKYKNQSHIGEFLGNLAAEELKNQTYDLIIAIPSHPKTERFRGYNQVTKFAETLSKQLNVEFKIDLLKRIKRLDSQTHKNKAERFNNLQNSFLASTELANYQNILLLDDVITTSATVCSCVQEIQRVSNAKVSVYAMAKVT